MNKQTLSFIIVAFIAGLILGLLVGYILWRDNIVCNKPYIRVETNCCLDQNSNKICDKDEIPLIQLLQTTMTTQSITTTIILAISETSTTIVSIPTTTTTVSRKTSTTVPKTIMTIQGITTAIVSKVIDGDTIKLQTGETVRLLGINTPEMGQQYYEESTNRLKELIEGKTVNLEKDVEDKDQYGRLLRYIYIDNTFVNLEMVREGYADLYIYPNTKYKNELIKARKECEEKGIRVCRPSKECSRCIGISYFHWNAEGDDCKNLNDEYVIFINTCNHSFDITGFTVKDESSRNPYIFPSFILNGGATVTLYTGCGINTKTQLYWCSSGYSCNAIWNNNGDTLYLRDSNGNLCINYSYEGYT